MNNQHKFIVSGAIIGFIIWVCMLGCNKMKGTLVRPNDKGEMIFTPINIWNFMIAPFKHTFFWTHYTFYIHNWILMCSMGSLLGQLIYSNYK
jgi:hypothetical protein